MKIKAIISLILCTILIFSLISCADPQSPENTSRVPAESPETPADTTTPDTSEDTSAPDTTAEPDAGTTAEEATTEETTAEPPIDLSAKQIPEGYYISAETEFPLIITLGGEQVEGI